MSQDTKNDPVFTPKDLGKYSGLETLLRADREITLGEYFLQEFETPNGECVTYVNGQPILESYKEAQGIIFRFYARI